MARYSADSYADDARSAIASLLEKCNEAEAEREEALAKVSEMELKVGELEVKFADAMEEIKHLQSLAAEEILREMGEQRLS